MKHIPNKIFLNLGENLKDFEDFNELGEVTWCADKVGDGDIEYTRKPIWHDLRKVPNNLPKEDKIVLVKVCESLKTMPYYIKEERIVLAVLTTFINTKIWHLLNIGTFNISPPDVVIAWMEIPEFK